MSAGLGTAHAPHPVEPARGSRARPRRGHPAYTMGYGVSGLNRKSDDASPLLVSSESQSLAYLRGPEGTPAEDAAEDEGG